MTYVNLMEYKLNEALKNRLNALAKEVLENVKPSKQEIDETKFAINEVMGRLLKSSPKEVEILLAGSAARGTQLKGSSDIDIFLLFPKTMKKSAIEKIGLGVAKRIVNKKKNESFVVKYAEHPYTRLFLNDLNINVDIVPAYKINHSKERGTAVDRTQLHNEFVNSNLTEKQRDNVRMLKAFLKAHNIYGAEARIEGFSGYLCELLVYHFNSFPGVLVGTANIKLPLILGAREPEHREPLKFFGKNFVVVDPTDPKRNVAANVSEESLFRFVIAARRLLKSPDKKTFYWEKLSDIYSEKRLLGLKDGLDADLYVLHFQVPDIADEIIWQQTKKIRLRLSDALKENGFEPIISLQNSEKKDSVIAFFVRKAHVSVTKKIGPRLDMGNAADEFMKVHSGALMFVEGDRIYAIEDAKHKTPDSLIRGFLKSKLPSYLNAKRSSLYINKVPENYAKLIYTAYQRTVSV